VKPVSRVADERILKSFYYVVDEAFSAPDHEDLRFLARNVVNQLLAATTVPTIVYALDEAAQLNARALHAFGGGELSLFTTPSTSLTDTPTQTAPATPTATEGLDLEEVTKRLKTSARDSKGKQRQQTAPPPVTSYFSLTIMQRPETLLVAWPVRHSCLSNLGTRQTLIITAQVEFGATFLEATAAIAQHLRDCRREPSFVVSSTGDLVLFVRTLKVVSGLHRVPSWVPPQQLRPAATNRRPHLQLAWTHMVRR
jgi:hypothetical protein